MTADSVGAILLQFAEAEIRNSTIVGNSANFVGGVQAQDSTLTLESTILAGNTDSAGINDINRLALPRRARGAGGCVQHSRGGFPAGAGWMLSTQWTSSGLGSTFGRSRFTTTGSCPLRHSTHDSGSSSFALISWCGTYGGT